MKMFVLFVMVMFFCGVGEAQEWKQTRKKMLVTAYCPCRICCGKHANGKTATMSSAWEPGAAVDPKVIPHGSRIDVPGYKRGPNKNGSWIKADDSGSAIKGNKIDLRFDTHQEAKEWGRKWLVVRIWTRK